MNKPMRIDDTAEQIKSFFNDPNPHVAYICGGLRRISVDSADTRARRLLLRRGIRYFTKMQAAVFAAHVQLKPTLFVDVGVNYGECLFAKPLFDRTPTIGFEANPTLLPHVEKSAVYNDDVRIELIPKAVSNSSKSSLTFYVNSAFSGKSSAAPPASLKGISEIKVPCTTLDAEILPRKLDLSTMLLKVDVEGFEPMVLEGAVEILKEARNVVLFVEFDSDYIAAAGVSARAFFDSLLGTYCVFEIGNSSSRKIESYADLPILRDAGGQIHVDLALGRFADRELEGRFLKQFCGQSLKKFAGESWGLS